MGMLVVTYTTVQAKNHSKVSIACNTVSEVKSSVIK